MIKAVIFDLKRVQYYREHFPDLFKGFDAVYFSWETGYVKPEPEPYRNFLMVNQLRPEEVLYFDDSVKNIEVAKSLGINAREYEGLGQVRKDVASLMHHKNCPSSLLLPKGVKHGNCRNSHPQKSNQDKKV